jgi:macrodomain Ter protein organizer (MatP/YcbG family)
MNSRGLIRKSLWLLPAVWHSLLAEAEKRNQKPSKTLEILITEAIESRKEAELNETQHSNY